MQPNKQLVITASSYPALWHACNGAMAHYYGYPPRTAYYPTTHSEAGRRITPYVLRCADKQIARLVPQQLVDFVRYGAGWRSYGFALANDALGAVLCAGGGDTPANPDTPWLLWCKAVLAPTTPK